MTETTADALARVTDLDEERRKYEGWLAQLGERRESTPEHVLARVREDYEARHRDVVQQLGSHADLLRASVDELGERVTALCAEEQQCADERAEAELRAAVGEYDAERWHEIESRTSATLADLAGERQQVEEELSRLRHVLELAAPAPVQAESLLPEVEAPRETSSTPGASQPAVSVSDSGSGWGARRDDAVPVESLAPEPADAHVNPSLWTSGTGSGGNPGHGGLGLPPSSGGEEASNTLSARRNSSVTGSDGGTSQVKTLKCQECGTMNYPTEWYCERCGGELAAL